MTYCSNAQRDARDRVRHLAASASGLPLETLAEKLMVALQLAVPCEGYRLFGLDPSTRLINRLLAASDNDDRVRLEWLRDVYLANGHVDYTAPGQLTRLNLPAVALHERQETCWGYPTELLGQVSPREHRWLYHELGSPVGGILLANFEADGQWVAAVQLYRRERNYPFTPTEVAFVDALAPAIGRSIAASRAREHALRSTGTSVDTAGVLLLAPDHRVTVCTPAGEAWLDRLRDIERAGHAPLPTAIWSVVAALRRSELPLANAVTTQTINGPVRIEASAAGPDHSVAVVISPIQAPEPPTIPVAWGLTLQERRVVRLLLRGYGNREIANALYVTENTIEWHLRHVYQKLDVRSRSQVLARFFREAYMPALSLTTTDDTGGA